MKNIIKLMVMLIVIFQINNVMADENIIGTWQGDLIVAPGSELTTQFIITQEPNGSYSVILNSPDQGAIKNVKANSAVYTSGVLKLDVAELSGSYEGIVKDGKIEGNWKQEGTSFPLNLSPFQKREITQKDIDEAEAIANKFIEFMDNNKFSAAYTLMDKNTKRIVTEEQYNDQHQMVRNQFGKTKSRNKLSTEFKDEMGGVTGGNHVETAFETTFENEKQALIETIIMTDEDSEWKVSAYFFVPREIYEQMQSQKGEMQKKSEEAEKK